LNFFSTALATRADLTTKAAMTASKAVEKASDKRSADMSGGTR
jgi:hypothetical protein